MERKDRNIQSNREKVPDSLIKALIATIWESRFRLVYLFVVLVIVATFSIWATLPDNSKTAILTKFGITEQAAKPLTSSPVANREIIKPVSNTFDTLPIDPRLLKILKEHDKFDTIWFVPLAQVNLTNDRIVLIWPAFTPNGHFIDNNA